MTDLDPDPDLDTIFLQVYARVGLQPQFCYHCISNSENTQVQEIPSWFDWRLLSAHECQHSIHYFKQTNQFLSVKMGSMNFFFVVILELTLVFVYFCEMDFLF